MATNPNYTMSELGASFSYGETAAYIIVLGDKENGLVNRSRVEYLFGKLVPWWVEVVVESSWLANVLQRMNVFRLIWGGLVRRTISPLMI